MAVDVTPVLRPTVLDAGVTQRLDRTDDPDESLWVFADPAGRLFCVFVAGPS